MKFIKVKVHAGEKKQKILRKNEDSFELWIKSPAERGLANDEVLEIIAEQINIPKKKLRIIKGAKTPNKILEIIG